jgi:hypothetical protein
MPSEPGNAPQAALVNRRSKHKKAPFGATFAGIAPSLYLPLQRLKRLIAASSERRGDLAQTPHRTDLPGRRRQPG